MLPWLFWTPAILMPSNETVVFLQSYCLVHEELATVTLAIRLMPELRAFARIAGQPDRPRKGKMFVELRVQSFIVQRCDRRHNVEGSSQASVAKLIRGSQRGSKFVRTQPTRASPGEAFVSRPGPKAATTPHPPPRVASQKHPTVLAHTVSRKRSTPNSRDCADP